LDRLRIALGAIAADNGGMAEKRINDAFARAAGPGRTKARTGAASGTFAKRRQSGEYGDGKRNGGFPIDCLSNSPRSSAD
jgi:hypothetical protein